MNLEYFSLTDTGQLRENNEDSVALDLTHQLAVLADGMGGYNAGEVASAMATSFIITELGQWLTQVGPHASVREVRRALDICVGNANRAIYNAALANPAYAGMGTTLVMCVFRLNRAFIAHVGDSRCYRLRGGTLARLTRDHSLLQDQLDAGLISPAQAPYAPHRNLVTRALGVETGVVLDVKEVRIEPGDMFLLCSDGLSDMLSDARMAGVLRASGTLVEKGRALVQAANRQGGRDNISVILVGAGPQAQRRGFLSRWLGR